jgi:diguanylate cyclase
MTAMTDVSGDAGPTGADMLDMDAAPRTRLCGVDVTEALRLLKQTGTDDPGAGSARNAVALQRVVDALCALSSQDGLTGLANRRALWGALEREIARSARTGETFALMLIDIDHFKRVNDQYGHLTGDLVLRAVARMIEASFRAMDTVARFGGEEFAVILPNSPPAYSQQVARRACERIAGEPIDVSPDLRLFITVSIGVACSGEWSARDTKAMVEAVDRNLYRAKRLGRNRVCWEPTPGTALTGAERAQLFAIVG